MLTLEMKCICFFEKSVFQVLGRALKVAFMEVLEVVFSPEPKGCSSVCVRSNAGAVPFSESPGAEPGGDWGGKAFHTVKDVEIPLPRRFEVFKEPLGKFLSLHRKVGWFSEYESFLQRSSVFTSTTTLVKAEVKINLTNLWDPTGVQEGLETSLQQPKYFWFMFFCSLRIYSLPAMCSYVVGGKNCISLMKSVVSK